MIHGRSSLRRRLQDPTCSRKGAAVVKQLKVTIVDIRTFSNVGHAKNLPNSAKNSAVKRNGNPRGRDTTYSIFT